MAIVITSQTIWPSAEGLDDFSSEGEGKRFDEFALVFDKNSPMMSEQRGHRALMFQLPANGVLSAVKLKAAKGEILIRKNFLPEDSDDWNTGELIYRIQNSK